jgi:FAD:protein FMN transferase
MPTAAENATVGVSSHQFDAASALRRTRWNAMGTVCELQFACPDPAAAEAFVKAAMAWVERFEARYSRFRPTSIVSQINAAAGRGWVDVDEEMEQLLGVCGTLHFMTQGVLDVTTGPLLQLWNYRAENPRVPTAQEIAKARELVGWPKVQRRPGQVFLPASGMAIDLGGWGKEFAVDAVAQLAGEFGITTLLVDFGHDLRALGTPPGKPAWHIGLEDPTWPGRYRGSIAVKDRGVACSGDYMRGFTVEGRRYGHIIDPRTGWPVSNGCLQATVVAASCFQAGVLSTAAIILGAERGLKLIQDTFGAEGVIVCPRARHQTRGFFQYVVES